MRRVYLDHQSGSPLLPEVVEAMKPFGGEAFGNPSSLHQHGLRARDAIGEARAQVARFINAESPEEIIFTASATESANLAVKGTAWANRRKGNHIIASKTEHPATLNSIAFLEKNGFTSTLIDVDGEGRIDPARIRAAITDKTILIAVHHVNHEIGTVQNVREIADIAREAEVALYVDADASAGWLPIDVQVLGADLLSFAPNRIYGPTGVGVLYKRRRARLEPLLHGGDQEWGLRAGVENVPGIVGAEVAAEIAQHDLAQRAAHCAGLQKRLWDGLRERILNIRLNGPEPGPGRSPANLNISVAGIEGEGQVLMCDTRGISIASGTACLSKSLKPSHVLDAIGVDRDLAKAAIIISLGSDNNDDDVDYFLETYPKIIDKLRAMSPS
jgi:cysteine desulfurase